ncbi:MAG: superoxide dismutase family protein [Polyangiaceae bacterium]|nr:superoxide dismutase family protein [Polyangiaceae bacterium]
MKLLGRAGLAGAVLALAVVGCEEKKDAAPPAATASAAKPAASAPASAPPAASAAPAASAEEAKSIEATAELKAAKEDLEIDAELTDSGKGSVEVKVTVDGGAKKKKYAAYVYDKGDCTDLKKKSFGALVKVEGNEKASFLGTIELDEEGAGSVEKKVEKATLKKGAPGSFLGLAVVVHGSEDKDGPQGDAIACGVIKLDD